MRAGIADEAAGSEAVAALERELADVQQKLKSTAAELAAASENGTAVPVCVS